MVVGDLIEVCVLIDVVLGECLVDCLLFIGLVKINIGYFEMVFGMVGLLKVVLCLKYCVVLCLLYFVMFNFGIDFDGGCLCVVDCYMWFDMGDVLLMVGVNLFGFGGMNVYVVLMEVLVVNVVLVVVCEFELI